MAKMVTYDSILNGQRVTFQAPENASNEELDRLASEALARSNAERPVVSTAPTSGSIRTLKEELAKARGQLLEAQNRNDEVRIGRAQVDVNSLVNELQRSGVKPDEIAAVQPASPTVVDRAKETAKEALGGAKNVAAASGMTEEELMGILAGAGLGMAEKVGLGPAGVTQSFATPPAPPGAAPVAAPSGIPQGGGATSGERWAAKTGYGVGSGTVQDVSSRYQRAAGQGPISSRMAKTWGVPQPGESPQLAQRLIDRSAAPRVGALDQVTNLFRQMAERTPRAVADIAQKAPILSYPLAGYSIGSDIGGMRRELARENPNYLDALLLGTQALGTGLSVIPATAPVGLPMALGSAGLRKLGEAVRQRELTDEEREEARRMGYVAP